MTGDSVDSVDRKDSEYWKNYNRPIDQTGNPLS